MDAGPGNLAELHERASRPSDAVVDVARSIDSDILVIGAGGKMGFHLCKMLQRSLDSIQSRHRVIAVSRFGSQETRRLFHDHGLETLATDLLTPGAVHELPESGNVFFLAGVKFGTRDDTDLLRQMNIELPQQVGRRFRDSRIVALSTGCVYSFVTPESGGSVESDPLVPPGEYAKSCLGRERAFSESGAATSLVRLNYSVDLRYGVVVDIAQKVRNRIPIDVSTGYANVIWQGDANRYIIQALPCATTPPFVINITGAATLSIRKVAERFGELFEMPVEITGVESNTAWLSNADRSHQLWGPPSVDENLLIEWVANWLKSGGTTLDKPTHFEVRDGKY